MKRLLKYFRKNNMRFIAELFIPLLTFIISNLFMIHHKNLNTQQFLVLAVLCIFGFVCFISRLHYKYEYYHGLVDGLKKADQPFFLILSYIAKTRNRNKSGKVNDYKIINVRVIYDITNVPTPGLESNASKGDAADLTVTYVVDAVNGNSELGTIYHTLLNRGGIRNSDDACYHFDDERKWYPLKWDSYHRGDHALSLWSILKEGNFIQPNQSFRYKIRFKFRGGFKLFSARNYLIDPANYSTDVENLEVIFRSEGDNLKKFINDPYIRRYENGMNKDDKRSGLKLQSKESQAYKTYFYYRQKDPSRDGSHYILSVKPKTTGGTRGPES